VISKGQKFFDLKKLLKEPGFSYQTDKCLGEFLTKGNFYGFLKGGEGLK
jgi:hypothetical protein